MDLLDKFKRLLSENKVGLNPPITTEVISKFEEANNVKFSSEFSQYFLTGNGFFEDELCGLANLWPLEKIERITDFFKFNGPMTNDINEAIEKNLLYNRINADGGDLSGTLKWQKNDANSYFVFGDYNVNSCYWAIKLTHDNVDLNEIICIYDWGNTYKVVASSFFQFLSIFVQENAEALI